MSKESPSLFREQWYVIDETISCLMKSPIQSFAMDDTLCSIIANDQDWGIARSWVHKDTVVLGIQEPRLPHINSGLQFLQDFGYEVIVRNSGGLAVVLDEGIYNLSLIFADEKKLTIDTGYELMVQLVKTLLGDIGHLIEDGEIKESYCPGRYDLSISGKKFAGISQRRLRGGVAIQIYIAVTGSGAKRAQLVKEFYERAVQGAPTKYEIPRINISKMASLEELSPHKAFTINSLQQSLLTLLSTMSNSQKVEDFRLSNNDWKLFEENVERMKKRNKNMNESL